MQAGGEINPGKIRVTKGLGIPKGEAREQRAG